MFATYAESSNCSGSNNYNSDDQGNDGDDEEEESQRIVNNDVRRLEKNKETHNDGDKHKNVNCERCIRSLPAGPFPDPPLYVRESWEEIDRAMMWGQRIMRGEARWDYDRNEPVESKL